MSYEYRNWERLNIVTHNSSITKKSLPKPLYWLVTLAAALVNLHLTLLYQFNKLNFMSLSILVWLTIIFLIWDKKERFKLDSEIFLAFLG
ncbi:hypothetical protein ETSB_0794 [cyanobacterium endosymbiont of Epithemia turgida isolate EtSB Lake Yunoko]|nr:hypothetical protein ETSB_0794 [cyanobacterium endosymbiont of Epithemia turgida isolate EtSB Lake Yunoko]